MNAVLKQLYYHYHPTKYCCEYDKSIKNCYWCYFNLCSKQASSSKHYNWIMKLGGPNENLKSPNKPCSYCAWLEGENDDDVIDIGGEKFGKLSTIHQICQNFPLQIFPQYMGNTSGSVDLLN